MSRVFFVGILLMAMWSEALTEAVQPAESAIQSQTTYPELGITQMTLRNGMRICLKPTTFEEDEILIRLTAKGGYATLPAAQRAAGELAAQIAWESGLEGMSTDKLTALIYEHSIELYAKVLPYHRIIEGTTESGGVKVFFDLIKRYSTQKQFTREGFDKISQMAREMIRSRIEAHSSPIEEWMRAVHTQDVAALKPLSLQELNTMEFERAKQFFEEYFTNPADFTCVIVGNFDVEAIAPLVNTYLGALPPKSQTPAMISVAAPAFPEGTVIKRIPAPGAVESLARLTFPLAPIDEPKQLRMAELMAQILETRLRNASFQKSAAAQGLTVTLELPLYPDLGLTWLAVQYRSRPTQIEIIQKALLDEIKRLSTQGPTPAELAVSWNQLRQKEAVWHKDNHYWLTILSDYFLRGWQWEELKQETLPSSNQVKEALQSSLKLDRYTFVFTSP